MIPEVRTNLLWRNRKIRPDYPSLHDNQIGSFRDFLQLFVVPADAAVLTKLDDFGRINFLVKTRQHDLMLQPLLAVNDAEDTYYYYIRDLEATFKSNQGVIRLLLKLLLLHIIVHVVLLLQWNQTAVGK